MTRYSIKRNKRRKALFGEAIAGAGITAAATLAAAAMQTRAAESAANMQAKATASAARKQADALIQQNETANENQQEMIDFQKEQNELNRQDYNRMMMAMQMAAGQQNVNSRLLDSKIQVRNGGRRSIAGQSRFPLRGSSNMRFAVTDGGGVDYLGTTPEGFDLYQVEGDTHNQYHKTSSGKYKTGVGFKFEDGSVVEAEGNGKKKSNGGELMLTTPNDAFFISKHNIDGFNPADAVMSGMHPLDAYQAQEQIKDMNGISDSGEAKYGRRLRRIAGFGDNLRNWLATGNNSMKAANWIGSGISTLGNLGGAWISSIGNNKAANIAANAAAEAGNIMGDAYARMQTIDPSIISREDYNTGYMLPVLQTVRGDMGSARAALERSTNRQLTAARRGNLSSANEQSLSNKIESNYIDTSNIISGKEEELKNSIRANNMKAINEASKYNLYANTQGRNSYTNARLQLAMYNNSLLNDANLGRANALATASGLGAQARADALTANSSAWANALTSSASSIANTIGTNAKMDFDTNQADLKYERDMENTLTGANTDSKIEYVSTHMNDSRAKEYGNDLLNSMTPGTDTYKRLYKVLYGVSPEDDKNSEGRDRRGNIVKCGGHVRRSLKR